MIVPVLASVVVASLVQYKEDSEMLLKVTSVIEHLEKHRDCCIPFFLSRITVTSCSPALKLSTYLRVKKTTSEMLSCNGNVEMNDCCLGSEVQLQYCRLCCIL